MSMLGSQFRQEDVQDLVLPVELYHHILDHCDDPTIIACLSVNRIFREGAERCLFRTVKLKYDRYNQKASRHHQFKMLLEAAPHLANCVQRIDIDVVGGSSVHVSYSSTHTEDLSFIQSLPFLRHLQHITLVGKGEISDLSRLHNLDWTALPICMQDAFIQAFHSSSISTIQISTISNFPYAVLSKCTFLKHLSLSDMESTVEFPTPSKDSMTSVSRTQIHHRPMLDFLTIRDWCEDESIEARLLSSESPVDILHLHKLSLTSESLRHHREVAHLLRNYGASIEQLELSVIKLVQTKFQRVNLHIMPQPPLVYQISLDNLQRLSTLRIKTWMTMQHYTPQELNYSSPLPWVFSLLMTLPSSNILTELYIDLSFMATDPAAFQGGDWELLTGALFSDRLSSLRSVRIIITTHFPSPHQARWTRILENNEHLSKLIGKGFLRILPYKHSIIRCWC
ncbi:hypothetical protein B0H34DRAFT_400673 [Crassisporium funariophilum]|nr:hypothetical protein B0H34DRAFT_400673 [Crassisporium funariophilum]